MTKKGTAILALALLLAPAAFGQTAASQSAAPAKTLREEIRRDAGDMTAKTKAGRVERAQLLSQEKVELGRVTASVGTRAEKKRARLVVRAKYAQLLKDARAKTAYQRKNLREDISSKRVQIKKLRQS